MRMKALVCMNVNVGEFDCVCMFGWIGSLHSAVSAIVRNS